MALNPEDINDIFDAVVSHAQASGYFDRVNQHEPKNAPGHGLTCAVWVQDIGPLPGGAGSGLRATTGRLLLNARIYSNMVQEPQDAIDPNVLAATTALLAAYSADFTLDGLIRNVDLLGAHGVALRGQAGYLTIGGSSGNTMYRVMTITLPLIVNDLWEQTP